MEIEIGATVKIDKHFTFMRDVAGQTGIVTQKYLDDTDNLPESYLYDVTLGDGRVVKGVYSFELDRDE
jgi:GH15 family glucan-1,4-alpha-glucosidase